MSVHAGRLRYVALPGCFTPTELVAGRQNLPTGAPSAGLNCHVAGCWIIDRLLPHRSDQPNKQRLGAETPRALAG